MEFYGLLGKSLSHSLSPDLHKELYRKAEIDAGYKLFPFPPESMSEAMNGLRALTIRGVNVTIPYKETVLPYLDTVDSKAQALGVVNTIHQKEGKLIGYNTDYDGFGLIFNRRHWTIEDKTIIILGSGGASKMAQHYVLDHGAKQVFVVSRSPKRFENTEKITYTSYGSVDQLTSDYLINTTPIGMYPNTEASPVSKEVIQQSDTLIDLIYNPYETRFLSIGEDLRKQTANGLDMLVGQAVKAVEIWEERSIDTEITDQLIEHFSKRQDEEL